MAQIKQRQRAGGSSSYRVTWVEGGGRRAPGKAESSETFTKLDGPIGALAFQTAVERAGQHWPDGWVKGEGWQHPDPQPTEQTTLETVADAYFAHQAKRVTRNRLKSYTLHRYRRTYALHLVDDFSKQPFADISFEDVDNWVQTMLDDGHAPKSIRNWHGLLYSIMAFGANRLQLRNGNPCDGTDLPESEDDRQISFFTHDEWRTFRACLKDDVHLLVDVLIMTGMRWGEVSALRVSDVTVKDGGDAVLYIQQAWSKRDPDDNDPIRDQMHENRSWKLGLPKGRKKRRVVLAGDVAARISEHVDGRGDSEYLFHTRSGVPWRYPDFSYDRWRGAREDARAKGLEKRLTPHMLRHTAVVWSLADGVPIEKISHMLGHASIQITYDVYGGLLDLTDPQMAQAMAARMAA